MSAVKDSGENLTRKSFKPNLQKQTLAFDWFFHSHSIISFPPLACFVANEGLLYGIQSKEKLITSHIITGNAFRKHWAQPSCGLKPWRLVQLVNGPLSADLPLCPEPSLIFGEGMSWLLQMSRAQLFAFPLSEQSCFYPAAWCCVYIVCLSKCKLGGILTRCTSCSAHSKMQGKKTTVHK